jgi:hypothetical protein
MSKGPGLIQRGLVKIFAEKPADRFTVEDLARLIYGRALAPECEAVRRALKGLPTANRQRIFPMTGWRYVYGAQIQSNAYDFKYDPDLEKATANAIARKLAARRAAHPGLSFSRKATP